MFPKKTLLLSLGGAGTSILETFQIFADSDRCLGLLGLVQRSALLFSRADPQPAWLLFETLPVVKAFWAKSSNAPSSVA